MIILLSLILGIILGKTIDRRKLAIFWDKHPVVAKLIITVMLPLALIVFPFDWYFNDAKWEHYKEDIKDAYRKYS